MTLKNRYPEQFDTHERQQGGQTPARGEKHDQTKAKTITADRRFSREVVTPAKEKE